MSEIKVIAWDVYDTIILNEDLGNEGEKIIAREHALETILEINKRGLIQCTVSDGDLKNLNENLHTCGINPLLFDYTFKMHGGIPKDFSRVFSRYRIKPSQLLVVGDSEEYDICPALQQGAQAFTVRTDSSIDDVDLRKILLQLS